MPKTIVLDANLLVLLTVGLTDRKYILVHKRLKAYRIFDFELLMDILDKSGGIIVTPNAFTEASNLLRQINEPAKSRIGATFQFLISKTEEIYVKSVDASLRSEFLRLGVADSAILELGRTDIVIFSVDHNLY